MTTKAKKNLGGRKPGTWTLLTQDQLKSWRRENQISRLRLARALGVSPTSVQNWEVGEAIPTTQSQEKLLAVMKSPSMVPPPKAPAFMPPKPTVALSDVIGRVGDVHDVIGRIVQTYLATGAEKIAATQLPVLVASVRSALVG